MELPYLDLDNLCRLCATSYPLQALHPVENAIEQIEMCLPIKIDPDDQLGLSLVICDNCLKLLDQFVDFIMTSLNAQEIIQKQTMEKKDKPCKTILDKPSAWPDQKSEIGSKIKLGPRKTFRCVHCSKVFRCSERLTFHTRAHTAGTDPGVCLICGKNSPSELCNYKHYLYNHTTRSVCRCDICGKRFSSKSSLRYHERCHASLEAMRPFSCHVCHKRFARRNTLRDHLQSQHGPNSVDSPIFECGDCHEVFPSSGTIACHFSIHHGDKSVTPTPCTLSQLYICEYCKRCFPDDSILMRHKLSHSPSSFQCKICNQEFGSYDEMKTHLGVHSSDGFTTKFDFRVTKVYVCEFCEAGFQVFSSFREHFVAHQEALPYKCKFCGLAFAFLGEAIEHRSDHFLMTGSTYSQPMTFANEVPGPHDWVINNNSNSNNEVWAMLQRQIPHDSSGRLGKVLICELCYKTFNSLSSMRKHMRVHTGERPYSCKQCGKQFTQSSGLSTHSKVHSAARPYVCDICDSKFKLIGLYKQHVRKHSGLRAYHCPSCPKTFMTHHAAAQHTKIHLGVKPHQCEICQLSFGRAYSLKVHRRRHQELVYKQ